MRIVFRATRGQFFTEYDGLTLDISGYDATGKPHYLGMVRATEESDPAKEDGGSIYLELDDQSGGGSGGIAACRFSERRLEVVFSRKRRGASGVDIDLRDIATVMPELRAGLPRIFRGRTWEAVLEMA
jgi:hypothetical protein